MRNINRYQLIHLTILFLLLISSSYNTVGASQGISVKIYGSGCSSCFYDYVDSIENMLEDFNIINFEYNYVHNKPNILNELNKIRVDLKVTEELKQPVASVINDKYIFEGYVPNSVIRDFIENNMYNFDSLVISYNKLSKIYKILYSNGTLVECNIDFKLNECIDPQKQNDKKMLTLILLSGMLDGINPCAFSVLLFFIVLLMGAKSADKENLSIYKMGITYIISVYITYVIIGLFFYEVIRMFAISNYITFISLIVMIIIGILNIKEYIYPNSGSIIRMSEKNWIVIKKWMRKSSYPATLVSGIMVAIFEFPCTGGIYVGIITMLNNKLDFWKGVFYLIIYNIMFILPLLIVFFMAVRFQKDSFSLSSWKAVEERRLKLFTGIVFLLLALAFYFVSF